MSTVQARVLNLIAEQMRIDASAIKPEQRFVSDLGCDSLDTVELLLAAEDEFAIEITDEEGEKLSTVQQAIDFIAQRVGTSTPA